MNGIQVICSKIRTLSGRQPFMLDRDMAMIYGTTARVVSQVVKRYYSRTACLFHPVFGSIATHIQ